MGAGEVVNDGDRARRGSARVRAEETRACMRPRGRRVVSAQLVYTYRHWREICRAEGRVKFILETFFLRTRERAGSGMTFPGELSPATDGERARAAPAPARRAGACVSPLPPPPPPPPPSSHRSPVTSRVLFLPEFFLGTS